jgi:hypothetical protein
MRPLFILFADPQAQIGLQLIDERYTFADDLPQGFRTMHYVRDWLPIQREQCAKVAERDLEIEVMKEGTAKNW